MLHNNCCIQFQHEVTPKKYTSTFHFWNLKRKRNVNGLEKKVHTFILKTLNILLKAV